MARNTSSFKERDLNLYTLIIFIVTIIIIIIINRLMIYIYNYTPQKGARGGSIEALRYKPEGRGFDYRLCHWNFH
jgi:hypothetical protein